ncbi:hypothetical protein BGW42_007662 [Actinomortierella wolfii]|nr:hypothetical protein BGW42_007662 [Actinomortierella wolfii]
MSSRVLRSNKRRLLLLTSLQDDPTAVGKRNLKKQKNGHLEPRLDAATNAASSYPSGVLLTATGSGSEATATTTPTSTTTDLMVPRALDKLLQDPELLRSISRYLWVRDIKSLMLVCRAWETIWKPSLYRSVGIRRQAGYAIPKASPQLDQFGHLIEKLYFCDYLSRRHGVIAALRSTRCSGRLIDMHIPNLGHDSRGTYSRILRPEMRWVKSLRVNLMSKRMDHFNDLLQRINTLPYLTSLTLEDCTEDLLLPLLRFLRTNKTVKKLSIPFIRSQSFRYSLTGYHRLATVPQAYTPLPPDLAHLDERSKQTSSSIHNGDVNNNDEENNDSLPTLWQNTNIVDLTVHCDLLTKRPQNFSHTAEFVHPDVRAFFGRLPNLKKCLLDWPQILKVSDFKYVAKTSLSNVTELKIKGYMVVMLPVLVQHCPQVTNLSIQAFTGGWQLHNYHMQQLQLQQQQQQQQQQEPVFDLPSHFTAWERLETLEVNGGLISDRQIEELAQSPTIRHTLKKLHLRHCSHISGPILRKLLLEYENLESLQLSALKADMIAIFETDRPWACYQKLKMLTVDLIASSPNDMKAPWWDDQGLQPSNYARFHVRRQLHALQALDVLVIGGMQFMWDMLNPWPTREEAAIELEDDDDELQMIRYQLDMNRRSTGALGKWKTKKTTGRTSAKRSSARIATRSSAAATASSPSNSISPTGIRIFGNIIDLRNNNAFPAIPTEEERQMQYTNLRRIQLSNDRRSRRKAFKQLYAEHAQSDAGWAPWMEWTKEENAYRKPILLRIGLLDAGVTHNSAYHLAEDVFKMFFNDWYGMLGLEHMYVAVKVFSRAGIMTGIKDHNVHLLREYELFDASVKRWPVPPGL